MDLVNDGPRVISGCVVSVQFMYVIYLYSILLLYNETACHFRTEYEDKINTNGLIPISSNILPN